MPHSIIFPADFESCAIEVEAKGWLSGIRVCTPESSYHLSFYDPIRLVQEVRDCLMVGAVFMEPNMLVISSINREGIQRAVDELVSSGRISLLSPD